eukprot:scaffold329_cov213-Chaetoceros_neogracile.AAC.2
MSEMPSRSPLACRRLLAGCCCSKNVPYHTIEDLCKYFVVKGKIIIKPSNLPHKLIVLQPAARDVLAEGTTRSNSRIYADATKTFTRVSTNHSCPFTKEVDAKIIPYQPISNFIFITSF